MKLAAQIHADQLMHRDGFREEIRDSQVTNVGKTAVGFQEILCSVRVDVRRTARQDLHEKRSSIANLDVVSFENTGA